MRGLTVHLLKLCVGIASVDQLVEAQLARRERLLAAGLEPDIVHRTRNTPRRAAELLDGGSLYWVIQHKIRVRQAITRIDRQQDGDGRMYCQLFLAPALIRVRARRCRPFQGWRYLEHGAAPPDFQDGASEVDDMPPEMQKELRELGLL